MKKNTNEDDFLLEEYKQVYEQFRHCDKVAQSKEGIFAVVSFGILALAFKENFSVWPLIGAAVVSSSLFFFHVIACRRMHFFAMVAIERLKAIESQINKDKKENKICFQNLFDDEYGQRARKNCHKKWLSIECMRSALASLLVILWIIIIVCKICNTNCFN